MDNLNRKYPYLEIASQIYAPALSRSGTEPARRRLHLLPNQSDFLENPDRSAEETSKEKSDAVEANEKRMLATNINASPTRSEKRKQGQSQAIKIQMTDPRVLHAIRFRNYLLTFSAHMVGERTEKYREEISEYCFSLTLMPMGFMVQFMTKIIRHRRLAAAIVENIINRVDDPSMGVRNHEREEWIFQETQPSDARFEEQLEAAA